MPRPLTIANFHYCETCKIRFYNSDKNIRFCSYTCRGKASTRGIIGRCNVRRVMRLCGWCLQGFLCSPKSRYKYCSRRCFDLSHVERMAGAKNPAYIDGSSYAKRGNRGIGLEQLRKQVYKRDKFTCQKCGRKCISKARAKPGQTDLIIQCHHIRHYRGAEDNTIDNLRTLCLRCHTAIHKTEKLAS